MFVRQNGIPPRWMNGNSYPRYHQQAPPPVRRRSRLPTTKVKSIVNVDLKILFTMGALLALLTLSLALKIAKGQLGHDQRQLSAYAYSSPQEPRAITKADPPKCQDRLDQEPVSQWNATYLLLLQKATYRRQPVFRCKVLRIRVAHHCGNSDHQTKFSTFRLELEVSPAKCRGMYPQQMWKEDLLHTETPICRSKTTIIRKELVRKTDAHSGADTQCTGAMYRSKGINIPDIMLWEELSITLNTYKLLVDKAGGCIVNSNQVRIGCKDTELSCKYSEGTPYWSAPTAMEKCRFHKIRRSTGTVVTWLNGTETFISRLEHDQANHQAAGTVVWRGLRTNYDKLYLVDKLFLIRFPSHCRSGIC
jgi:hypothetical protein